MSRIGKLPITIPSTVTVTFNNSELFLEREVILLNKKNFLVTLSCGGIYIDIDI